MIYLRAKNNAKLMSKTMVTPVDGQQTTAIVLAGGLSTRMGGPSKSHLLVGGITMIESIVNQLKGNFGKILISANPNQDFGFLETPVIYDLQQQKGPLMGLYSSLMASDSEINFVTTCDNPNPKISLIKKMIEIIGHYQAVVPISSTGKTDPLFAVYRKSVAERAKVLLDKNINKVMILLENIEVKYMETLGENSISNINTIGDYENFLKSRQVIM